MLAAGHNDAVVKIVEYLSIVLFTLGEFNSITQLIGAATALIIHTVFAPVFVLLTKQTGQTRGNGRTRFQACS